MTGIVLVSAMAHLLAKRSRRPKPSKPGLRNGWRLRGPPARLGGDGRAIPKRQSPDDFNQLVSAAAFSACVPANAVDGPQRNSAVTQNSVAIGHGGHRASCTPFNLAE